jgi:hypothetical protein
MLLHQRANEGFELQDTIATTNNTSILLRIKCMGAGESNVLAYAGLARKLTIGIGFCKTAINQHEAHLTEDCKSELLRQLLRRLIYWCALSRRILIKQRQQLVSFLSKPT